MIDLRRQIPAFFTAMARIFAPPFEGLPLILWCYVVFSAIASPHNPVWLGDLPDPDDYTYLNQTLDWLQGQSWFDNTQYRMSPPEGVPIHYTRFAELPIAGMILLFRLFHYSWHGAALLTSYLLPVIYLGLFFVALRWVAVRLMPPGWARFSCVMAIFANALIYKFGPGQVDHHGMEATLSLLAAGLAMQMFTRPDQKRWPFAAGMVLALATAMALEVLPWLALISAVIGLWGVMQGRIARKPLICFAVSLPAAGAVLLLLDRGPAMFGHADLLAYSVNYVWLMLGIAAVLAGIAAFANLSRTSLRLMLSATAAAGLGGLYLWHFPALLHGPYGAMDARLAALFFANLQEARAIAGNYSAYKIVTFLAPAAIALAASALFALRARAAQRWGWGLMALLLASALTLALFYQLRVLIYAELFAIVPLAEFVRRGWGWLATKTQGRQLFAGEIALFVFAGPLFAVLLPALTDNRSFNTGVLLFTAQGFDDRCPMIGLENLLNEPRFARPRPLHIMNIMSEGPELLFRTPHAVMAAPYHTNVRGNLDSLDFFLAADPAQAEKIARRDRIDLVLLCRDVPDMYLAGSGPHYALLPNGEKVMRPNDGLAARLVFHKPPGWLVEIPVPPPGLYQLFEVKP